MKGVLVSVFISVIVLILARFLYERYISKEYGQKPATAEDVEEIVKKYVEGTSSQ